MIESIKLNKYEPKNYLDVVGSEKWVEYGDDNLFPQYLIALYRSSAVHGALVNSIAQMIFGKGVEGDLELERLGINDEIRKACLDLKLQGGFYLEVHWNVDRDGYSKILHVPFERIRSGKMNDQGYVENYYYCLDWEDGEAEKVQIPCWNTKTKKENPVQLFVCKPFSVGDKYYPKPDYFACINWIDADKQVGIHQNSNLKNGMMPSFAIHWKNGTPPKSEREDIRREIEGELSGVENSGRFIMTFSDSADESPTFEVIESNDSNDKLISLSEECTDKIMIGHRVTSPALFGVKTAGQLGGTSEMEVSAEIFYSEVIKPAQSIIFSSLETIFNQVGVKISKEIKPNNPILEEESATVDKSYTGIQISSAVDIVTKVKTQELSEQQGVQLLISMLGFDEQSASNMFIQKQSLSKEFTKDDETLWLDYLANVGEKNDSEEWELISEEDVSEPEAEGKVHFNKVELFKRFANPEDKSEIDTGLYKIRYRYSQNISEKSRLFCQNMVANSKSGVIYRYEDIQSMEGVNKEFAPKGKSKYSIWLHKGGAYCHHNFVRQIYFRKRKGGKFLPNDGLENDKIVSGKPDIPYKDKRKKWNEANTAPIDTPSKGSLKNK